MTNLTSMLSSASDYANNMNSIFWTVFGIAAGLTVGVIVWRKFRKASSA